MNVGTISSMVNVFNNETANEDDKVDNTTSVKSLRDKIKAAQAKKKPTEEKKG